MLDIRKAELVEFLTTEKRPLIRYELEGRTLTLSRRPATIDELVDRNSFAVDCSDSLPSSQS